MTKVSAWLSVPAKVMAIFLIRHASTPRLVHIQLVQALTTLTALLGTVLLSVLMARIPSLTPNTVNLNVRTPTTLILFFGNASLIAQRTYSGTKKTLILIYVSNTVRILCLPKISQELSTVPVLPTALPFWDCRPLVLAKGTAHRLTSEIGF